MSPNVAPAMIDPIKKAGSAASGAPAGYSSGAHTRMVPRLVPVAVEKTTHTRKLTATKPPPLTPAALVAHTSAPTRPLSRSSTPSTAASSHASSMIMTIRRLIPSITASEYADLSVARKSPRPMAIKSTGQKPVSSGAPERPSQETPARKSTNGASAPATPPWKESGAGGEAWCNRITV